MSIVTNAQYQSLLTVAGETMSSADIDVLIDVAESRISGLCHRNFALHWENETIEIPSWDTRRDRVKAENYPIVQSTVMLTNESTLHTNDNLIIDYTTGIIRIRIEDNYFSCGRDAILLMYQCGWASGTSPEDFQYLVYKVGNIIQSTPGVAYQSERAGDYNYKMDASLITNGLDPIASSVLNKYKKVF